MISGTSLLAAFWQVCVVGAVCWILWWFIGYLAPPEPFNKVLRVIVALIAVFFLLNLLLSGSGHPLIRW
jgi:hypothetical protein